MDDFRRFALYYAPSPGPFASAAAAWLGRDAVTGAAASQPRVPLPGRTMAELTAEPRRYGFHGTLKPPFRLADGTTAEGLVAATDTVADRLAPVTLSGLRLASLDGFLALVPEGDAPALTALAARVVEDFEPFRAPLTEAEIARRRPETLTPRQRDLLARFGYPWVMEEFRFHLTLSGRLAPDEAAVLGPAAHIHFLPVLPRPFRINDLCLFGEDASGAFHLVHRAPLGG